MPPSRAAFGFARPSNKKQEQIRQAASNTDRAKRPALHTMSHPMSTCSKERPHAQNTSANTSRPKGLAKADISLLLCQFDVLAWRVKQLCCEIPSILDHT